MDSSNKDLKQETQVDVLLDMGSGLVLMQRTQEPDGAWRLPGRSLQNEEVLEEAALRCIKESTGLDAELIRQFHTYSYKNPQSGGSKFRVVFLARARGEARLGQGILENGLFHQMNLPDPIAWNQKEILNDFFLERY